MTIPVLGLVHLVLEQVMHLPECVQVVSCSQNWRGEMLQAAPTLSRTGWPGKRGSCVFAKLVARCSTTGIDPETWSSC